jgi:hypothetical protein
MFNGELFLSYFHSLLPLLSYPLRTFTADPRFSRIPSHSFYFSILTHIISNRKVCLMVVALQNNNMVCIITGEKFCNRWDQTLSNL